MRSVYLRTSDYNKKYILINIIRKKKKYIGTFLSFEIHILPFFTLTYVVVSWKNVKSMKRFLTTIRLIALKNNPFLKRAVFTPSARY